MYNSIYFYIKSGPFGVKKSMRPFWNIQFLKKLKLYKKLVPRQYMKVFLSKFICNSLYLFVIYNCKYLLQMEHHTE